MTTTPMTLTDALAVIAAYETRLLWPDDCDTDAKKAALINFVMEARAVVWERAETRRRGEGEMSEYGKIDTLFERDKATFVVDPSVLKSPVLSTIKEWDVTEKIDGTNIRVLLSLAGDVSFSGRTDKAQIPADLIQYLIKTFPPSKMQFAFWIEGAPVEAVLYGEGYGPGIQQGGGLYRKDKAFVLFDVLVSGKWWLDREAVDDVAWKLGIETAPYLGRMTLDQIVTMVRAGFPSKFGTAVAEGIVARPIEPLFDRKMKRIIIKLKTKDFQAGKR